VGKHYLVDAHSPQERVEDLDLLLVDGCGAMTGSIADPGASTEPPLGLIEELACASDGEQAAPPAELAGLLDEHEGTFTGTLDILPEEVAPWPEVEFPEVALPHADQGRRDLSIGSAAPADEDADTLTLPRIG